MSPTLAETLLMTGLVTLAVLLLRRPVAALFGARAAYALWLAPVLRMAWPLVPDLPAPPAATGDVAWIAVSLEPATRAVSALPAWLLPAWLGGAALTLAFRVGAHRLFMARALRQGRAVPGRSSVDLVATPAVEGPLATGLVHRLILVPADFDTRFTPRQQALAVAHEELHHRRGDLWACTAALVLTALNWFNPLAHLALAAFRRDMESACDAQLMALRSGETADYAETLLRCAARPVPRSLCALTSIDELKGRLTMLANTPSLARRLAGTTLALGLTAGGLALSLPASAEPGAPASGTYKVLRVAADGSATGVVQDAPKTGETQKVIKEVRIIETDGPDGKKVVRLEGKDGELKRECPGQVTGVSVDAAKDSGDQKKKAFIMICAKPGETKETAVQGLEKALARIQGDSDMDPAIKAELSAKLQAKIAEMKAK